MLRVYNFGGDDGWWLESHRAVRNPEEADLIIFPGGADINPMIYNQRPNSTTSFYESYDNQELDVYDKFAGKKAMLGICRGMQLLGAKAGGFLVQNMSHPYRHKINTYDGKELVVNSLHHQQVCVRDLPKDDYKLLGWSRDLSPYYEGPYDRDTGMDLLYNFGEGYDEPEAIAFPKLNILGVQFHPEFMTGYKGSSFEPTIEWCRELVNKELTF